MSAKLLHLSQRAGGARQELFTCYRPGQPINAHDVQRPLQFDYVEVFYNRGRIHSAAEYLAPAE